MQKPVSVIPGNSEAPNGPSGPLPWHGPAHRAARGRAGLTGPVHHLPWRVPLGTACPLFFRESRPRRRTCWLRAEPRLATLAPAPPGRGSSPQMAAGLRSSWGGRPPEASPAGRVSGSGADRPGMHDGQVCCGQGAVSARARPEVRLLSGREFPRGRVTWGGWPVTKTRKQSAAGGSAGRGRADSAWPHRESCAAFAADVMWGKLPP